MQTTRTDRDLAICALGLAEHIIAEVATDPAGLTAADLDALAEALETWAARCRQAAAERAAAGGG